MPAKNPELRLIRVIRAVVSPLINEDSDVIVSSMRDDVDSTNLTPEDVQVVTRRDGGIVAQHGLILTSTFTVMVFSKDSGRAAEVIGALMKKPAKEMKTEYIINYTAESTAVELEGLEDSEFEILAAEITITTRNQ